MRVARLFLLADWPEKYFSGQSEGGISNASGTRSVRVSAQGLSRSCCKLSPMKIPSSRLAAPGSPRMDPYEIENVKQKNSSKCSYLICCKGQVQRPFPSDSLAVRRILVLLMTSNEHRQLGQCIGGPLYCKRSNSSTTTFHPKRSTSFYTATSYSTVQLLVSVA